MALLFYLPMLAAGVFVRAPGTLRVGDWPRLGLWLALALAASGGVILLSRASRLSAWGQRMAEEFHAVLGGLTAREILWLSLLSAFGEEILFRGVLHPRIGLLWAAALFAAVHFPFRRTMWPWTAFAFAMGLGLGWLTDLSGSLWPAILVHLTVNLFNLHDIVEDSPPGTAGQVGRGA
jgi:membrane protease YdiL (CAAX protease family)